MLMGTVAPEEQWCMGNTLGGGGGGEGSSKVTRKEQVVVAERSEEKRKGVEWGGEGRRGEEKENRGEERSTLVAIGGIALVTGRGERVIPLGATAVGFQLLAVVVVAHLFWCENMIGWGTIGLGKNGVGYDRVWYDSVGYERM